MALPVATGVRCVLDSCVLYLRPTLARRHGNANDAIDLWPHWMLFVCGSESEIAAIYAPSGDVFFFKTKI
jgi:hypothetical protein